MMFALLSVLVGLSMPTIMQLTTIIRADEAKVEPAGLHRFANDDSYSRSAG